MYENMNFIESPKISVEKRQPEFVVLIERFQNAINRFDGHTGDIKVKLQNIKQYSEPTSKMESQTEKNSETFAEKTLRLICKVEEYNSRLEYNLRHLNEII